MKRILSILELKRYYSGNNPNRILFCSDNQSWHSVENPMKINMAFTSMLMACNPNVICLKSGDNTIRIERVKYVCLDADRSPLGTVLDVVCGNKDTKENDIRYTLITS